jgi:hypothetical protein
VISNPDRKILVLWVIALALITRRELRAPSGIPGLSLPNPASYFGSAIVYGLAAVLAEVAGDFAFFLALGWTIAIALNIVAPGEKPTQETGGGK